MDDYRFFFPITVRYGDLDPQGHVNNARYLTYMEQARLAYLRHLNIWQGGSFLDLGIILAEARVRFIRAIHWGEAVQVAVRCVRLGNKSFDMEYRLFDDVCDETFASGFTVQVAYDYRLGKTIPIPEMWRETIIQFENLA